MIRATAQRDGRFWLVKTTNVKPEALAQARRLDQAEDAMRDVLVLLHGESARDAPIEVTPKLVGSPSALVEVARWMRDSSGEAERLAQRAMATTAHQLRADGVSQRDIGRLLGLSFQRVSQLLKAHPKPSSRDELWQHLRVLEAGLAGVRKALEPEEEDARVHA